MDDLLPIEEESDPTYKANKKDEKVNKQLESALDYLKTGQRAPGLEKWLDKDWFIGRLVKFVDDAKMRENVRLEALVRLGQLLHNFWKPYDKTQPTVADVNFNEKLARPKERKE